jgi:hypothetical protein
MQRPRSAAQRNDVQTTAQRTAAKAPDTTMFSPARRHDRQDGGGLVRRELKTPKGAARRRKPEGRDDARTTSGEQVS